MTGTPPPGAPPVDKTSVAALQNALAAEHAALWCYSFIAAFLPAEQIKQADADADEHRTLRGALEQTLSRFGAQPVSAQPAYHLPQPVVDGQSAAALAVVAETDALAAWRSVVEHTTDSQIRQASLTALTSGTLRCARWRVVVRTPPAIPIFPGRP